MEVTITGKLKMYAEESVLEEAKDTFLEGDFDDEFYYVDLIGDAIEDDIEIEDSCLVIPFLQTDVIVNNSDFSRSTVEFMKKIATHFPKIGKMVFQGRYETWDINDFINFLCNYENGNISIYESENYDELDNDEDVYSIDFGPKPEQHRKDLDTLVC